MPDFWRAHLVQLVLGAGASGVLRCVFRPFCPPCRSACGAMYLKYAFIRVLRGFLAGFGVWMYVCIGLVLCVACGAFVCVSG